MLKSKHDASRSKTSTKTTQQAKQKLAGVVSLRGRLASTKGRKTNRRGKSRAGQPSSVKFIVVDANVVTFALLPKKAIPKNLAADALHSRRFLNRALSEGVRLIVPPEFSMEVLNGFTAAMWHKLITVSTAKRAVALIKKLNIEVRVPSQNAVLELTQKMNRASAGDQTYVVLASKLKCEFVTADGGLVRSAVNARVPNVVHVLDHPWSQ